MVYSHSDKEGSLVILREVAPVSMAFKRQGKTVSMRIMRTGCSRWGAKEGKSQSPFIGEGLSLNFCMISASLSPIWNQIGLVGVGAALSSEEGTNSLLSSSQAV